MRLVSLLLPATLLAIAAGPAAGQVRIGLSLPLGDTAPLLAEQMRSGAEAAAEAAGAELIVADDACSAEGGAAAARRFAGEDVAVAIGYLCTEAIEAALPILAEAGIPVITTGVRTASLTEDRAQTEWPVFRLAPRADREARAVGRILSTRWRDELFAIVDDGTIYARELAESLRAAAEENGLEPVYFDTFRPQLDNQIGLIGRLRNAGATHVFVGGDRADIAVIARDAAELDYEVTLAGGEALRAAPGEVALAAGVLMVAPPLWREEVVPELLAGFEAAGLNPEGYFLPTHAAVEIAVVAEEAAEASGMPIAQVLSSRAFPTIIGPVRFDANGDVGIDYHLYRYDGARFERVE